MDLCDGAQTMGEIMDAIMKSYPGRYRNEEHALAGVTSILAGKVKV